LSNSIFGGPVNHGRKESKGKVLGNSLMKEDSMFAENRKKDFKRWKGRRAPAKEGG